MVLVVVLLTWMSHSDGAYLLSLLSSLSLTLSLSYPSLHRLTPLPPRASHCSTGLAGALSWASAAGKRAAALLGGAGWSFVADLRRWLGELERERRADRWVYHHVASMLPKPPSKTI